MEIYAIGAHPVKQTAAPLFALIGGLCGLGLVSPKEQESAINRK
jgi:hypothetical protein